MKMHLFTIVIINIIYAAHGNLHSLMWASLYKHLDTYSICTKANNYYKFENPLKMKLQSLDPHHPPYFKTFNKLN